MSNQKLFVGGRIFTAGLATSAPLGVLVEGGSISHVAADDYLRELAPSAELVDLKGGLLSPSFTDAHLHPTAGGMELLSCELSTANDREETLTQIQSYVNNHPDVEWVLGGGWQRGFFSDHAPTREELDSVTNGKPAFLQSYDHHGAWVNTEALRRAEITASTPDPENGVIYREADGAPSGFLNEEALRLMLNVAPSPTAEQMNDGLLHSQELMLSYGITGWQDAIVGNGLGIPDTLETYVTAIENGSLKARVTLDLWWDYLRGVEQLEEVIERRGRLRAVETPEGLSVDTVKFMMDGVGQIFLTEDQFREALFAVEDAGFSAHIHACTDQAVHRALNAIEAARKRRPHDRFRHQIAHLFVVQRSDLRRFADLNVIANVQALWGIGEPRYESFIQPPTDPDYRRFAWPVGQLARAGALLAAGSDWPVSSADPIETMAAVTGRQDYGAITEEGRVDLATIYTAYTAGSASAVGRGSLVGRLSPGMLADFAVLDADPFEASIGNTKVISTWMNGEQVAGH